MDWPPNTVPLAPNPYLNPILSLYPPESDKVYPPPANPSWAVTSHFGVPDAPTFPNGGVSTYPPPPSHFNQPRVENYPPQLSPHQEYSPTASAAGDSWKDAHGTTSDFDRDSYPNWGSSSQEKKADSGSPFDGTTPSPSPSPFQPYPFLLSTDSYPPSSVPDNSSHNSSHNFSSPHGHPPFTSLSAPPPSSEFPSIYPPASNSPTPAWCAPGVAPTGIQGHTSSSPILPGGRAQAFGCTPASAHPLLQSDDEDSVPFEEDEGDDSDGEAKPYTYVEEFDYSHEELEKYGMNLTTSAKEGSLDPVIGRDDVVRRCIEVLTRRSKCNPVLVGHPGVGKTAVVEGLAQRIVKGDVPEPLRKCKIISIDVGNIVAGTEYRGQFEEKMKEVLDEATAAQRKVILFLDELHRLIGAGKIKGSPDTASEILKPALARGGFLCIGATTYNEYTKYIEQDQALARRFQKVVVDPPSAEDAISILRGLKPRLESHDGISIVDDALIEAVKLSERYIPDRFLPDKAIDLVEEALSKLKIGLISKPSKLDEIDRAILQLDMERLSVSAATGQSSKERLRQILSDLEGLKLRQANLTRKWKKEKTIVTRIVSLKEKITAVKTGSETSSSVSGLETDGDESSESEEEVHAGFQCDSCQMFPIIGPRFTHATKNLDLCQNCHESLFHNGGFITMSQSSSQFHRVALFQRSCSTCFIHPIVGNYYVDKFFTFNSLCQSCWRKVMVDQPNANYTVVYNNPEEAQTERSGSGATNLTVLEVQLEAAENEWKEYQKSYKPLIQLEVTSATIAEVLSTRTGIPVNKIQASQMEQLLQLDVELHKRVIGQDEACNAIARAIQRSRAGLSDPKRPIASLMFMGPTGVGKTELAKTLASHLFNSEDTMVRIDMSEYGEKNNISRLTGAAPGLVGFGEGGQLTTPVRRQPYSVVLFDEIEKAHDDIFNIFLQILDDGRLTDSEGHLVNFTNTVIIMTSNVGAEKIMEVAANAHGFGSNDEAYQVMKSKVMEAAREKYRPEFINRIDEFIVFQPLNPQQICEIVKLQLERVNKRLQDRLINLRTSKSALQLLSTMGYDPRYGARPVKRVIQQSIEDPLAQGILRGHYTEGSTIMVDTEFTSAGHSHEPQQKLTFYKLP